MDKSFDKREGWIWMNGNFIPWEKCYFSYYFSGSYIMLVQYLKVREHIMEKFLNLEEHTKRFFKSAQK